MEFYKVEMPALVLFLSAIVYLTINPWTDLGLTIDEQRLTDQPSIFVSRLKKVAGKNEYEHFSYGITNAIITALSTDYQLDLQSMKTAEFIEKTKLPTRP